MQGFTSFDPWEFSGERIVFAGNLAKISYPQGLSCYGCRDSMFVDNTLITLPGARWRSIIRDPGGINNTFQNNQLLDFRARSMEDVASITHSFSNYKPGIVAGSNFDHKSFVAAVPDPSIWVQLVAGFGLIGFMSRRSTRRYYRVVVQ